MFVLVLVGVLVCLCVNVSALWNDVKRNAMQRLLIGNKLQNDRMVVLYRVTLPVLALPCMTIS